MKTQPTAPVRRLRAIAANLALVVVAIALTLGLCEVAVRFVAPQQLVVARRDVWRPVETFGWMHQPNVRTTLNTGERPVDFLTDDQGFRIGRRPPAQPKKKILLLGDSFAAAMQVPYEQSIPGLLEARIPRQLNGDAVVVRNTGVNGYSPSHYLLWERRELSRERYDLVLVMMYLGNDILDTRTDRYELFQQTTLHDFRWPRSATCSEVGKGVLYPINDYLKQHSHLFILAKNQSRTLLMRLGLTYLYVPEEILKSNADKPRWQVTADVMRDIDTLGRSHGVPVLFVLIPGNYEVEPDVFRQYLKGFDIDSTSGDLEQPNRLLASRLAPFSLRTIDLLQPLREQAAKGKRLYGRVDVHFSPEGHDAVTRMIEPVVVSLLQGGACTPARPHPRGSCETP
jgi:lysophospholipase L1-like esterase